MNPPPQFLVAYLQNPPDEVIAILQRAFRVNMVHFPLPMEIGPLTERQVARVSGDLARIEGLLANSIWPQAILLEPPLELTPTVSFEDAIAAAQAAWDEGPLEEPPRDDDRWGGPYRALPIDWWHVERKCDLPRCWVLFFDQLPGSGMAPGRVAIVDKFSRRTFWRGMGTVAGLLGCISPIES